MNITSSSPATILKTPLADSALANTYAKAANLVDNPSQLENPANGGSAFSNLNHRCGASSTGAVVVKSSSAHSMSAQSCSTPNEDAEMRVSMKGGSVDARARGLSQKPGAGQEV